MILKSQARSKSDIANRREIMLADQMAKAYAGVTRSRIVQDVAPYVVSSQHGDAFGLRFAFASRAILLGHLQPPPRRPPGKEPRVFTRYF